MSDELVPVPAQPPADDAAAAFNAMREELALLRAAMGQFAVRQKELAARNYAPDLAQIIALQDVMVGKIDALFQRPALALTPKTMAREIEAAAVTARRADHEMLAEATRQQIVAAQTLNGIVGQARAKQQQLDAQIWSCLFGAGAVIILLILPQLISEVRALVN